jgi:hypothetical protein
MAVQAHYNGYLKALDSADHGTSEGQRGPFLEFKPRDPVAQAKHSAMSGSWEGVQSSEKAIARGDYDMDFASKPRGTPKAQPLATAVPTWNCSIQ